MAKLLSRLFGSNSSSRNNSFRGSQTSLNDTQNRSRISSSVRTSASLENLSSYHVNPKELEKNKLHKASWEGNLSKVERLAQPGQINLKDQHARTPLHLAIVKGHIEIVKYLVQKRAKLDVVDNEQRTPLIKAVLSGNQNLDLNYQICQVLLDGGPAYYINVADKHGKNALHYSIDFGNQRLVQLFLSDENCDPNYQDRDQMTPLHLAIKRNSPEIVRLLLSDQRDQQADPNIPNRYGQTPLHMAASVGYLEIVRLLLHSKLHEPCDPTILDSHQTTAYELAKTNHQEACAKLIEEYQEKVYKSPRRATSASFNEQASARATNSVSLVPAANQERAGDDTSDESSSILSASKPSTSSPRRIKRESDQWSDDNNLAPIGSRRKSHDLTSLLKSNPLQAAQATTGKSTIAALFSNNPLQTDAKKTARSTKPTISSQQTQPSPFFGIGPVIERVDSDNTSTSMSVNNRGKPAAPLPPQNKPSQPTALRPASNTKSWSDDTITAPVPKSSQVKARDPQSDIWDSSSSDDDSTVPKVNQVVSNLLKTQPLTAPATNSESDADSVETEIRRFDLRQPSNGTTVQNLVNKQIGSGYKVIGLSEVQSPQSEDSSWTTSPQPVNQQPTTKGTHHSVQKEKNDESTWDDSRPLSADIRNATKLSSPVQSISSPGKQTTGIGNLVKVTDTITHVDKKKSTQSPQSSQVIGKLVVSSMINRTEPTSHEIDVDEDDAQEGWRNKSEEWSVPSTHGPDSKSIRPLPRSSVPYDPNSLHEPTTSTKSSFNDLNELKENIKKLERNQDDTRELKRQLKEMESKKNDFEKLYKENGQILSDIQTKFEYEKSEKQRLQSTTKNLDFELKTIQQQLQSIEGEKRQLNQRCLQLQEERDAHDEKVRTLQAKSIQSTSVHSNDLDQMKTRHRDDMQNLSAANDDVHHRNRKLQSDVQVHSDSLNETVRYKYDLEKALEEKTFFQRELDRFKYEKELVEQERMVYKTKYDGLQDEIRQILLDRSKLEQKLTAELQEHIQEKQQSTNDLRKYRTEAERLNVKLVDAEASLHALQTQNQTLLSTKDRDTTLSHQLPSHPDQSYRKPLTIQTSTLPANHVTSRPPPHPMAQTLPRTTDNDRYLLQTSRQIRSDTERVKNELDLLRQDFDRLVSNYEPHPTAHSQSQLHSQIDIFRQFYEQEFRQRQSYMSKLTTGVKPIARNTSLSNSNTHNHSHNDTSSCTACTNTRLLRERLATAVDTSLAEQRLQTLEQLPRQASSLLTINTNHNGVMSSVELLRGYYNA